ncbi:DUF2780 domain-containing protein [Pseudomaricurvus sp. HS19]|uniref:DUF2780 domain-containing protein n=1 Tax=Pseudomaricurvus sp. HS19 TaxID=2692626 RepID=UPI00136F5347|nr:DUF2780 domain-containing protein [Pseudomaricurvus sp. HS19]MYM64404.1 hypothetical protein [Pseudomaricurvus sp. HS19]
MEFRKVTGCALLATMLFSLAGGPAQALGLGDLLGGAASEPTAAGGSTGGSGSGGLTDMLVGQLTDKLGISKSQATAGLGLLVSYASNNLPESYASQLKALLPTSSSSGSSMLSGLGSQLTGSVKSMADVNSGFETLGMDSSMVSSFTPLLESAVANTGASELAGALGALW